MFIRRRVSSHLHITGRCLLWVLYLLGGTTAGVSAAQAAGGPLGIDSKLSYDNSGLWSRTNQQVLQYGMLAGVLGGALWEGGESRLGRTFWYSVDATLVGGATSTVLKYVFSRERPNQTNDPNQWFTGHGQSFPSGEVTVVSAMVTPFVLEYGRDHPAVYALELLPIYDAIARMKVQGHWQTDVLAGVAIGTAAGYFMHGRKSPLVLGFMPHGIYVGLKKQF